MKKTITILLVFLLVMITSCNKYSYLQDKDLSTKEGILTDTAKGFILSELTFDGTLNTMQWDADRLNELNDYFLTTKEVVLYNYYLDRDIYRLVLSPKDEQPIIITVNKKDKDAWLVSKRIRMIENRADSIVAEADSARVDKSQPALPDYFDNYMKTWNSAHIQRFDSLFAAVDFFNLPIGQTENQYDSYYLMEVHQKDKYRYIYRPMDDRVLENLIEYMRSFSRF